jgi:oxaloacetate decarboxylase alpha subunit
VDSASFAIPVAATAPTKAGAGQAARYNVNVNGAAYDVVVAPAGTVAIAPAPAAPAAGGAAPAVAAAPAQAVSGGGTQILSPVAGTVLRYAVSEGAQVKPGDNVIIIESMKMELEIKATVAGPVHFLAPTGAQVASQQPVAEIGGSAVGQAPVAAAPVAAAPAAAPVASAAAPSGGGTVIPSPVAGTILRYAVNEGAQVAIGENVIIIESMKMELEIKATVAGSVHFLAPTGAQVQSQQPLAEIL